MKALAEYEKKNRGNNTNPEEGSGSRYHRDRAGHVPDYGGNIHDPVIEYQTKKKQ